ncbi:Ras GTPase [Entomophthora muscae]|uniref:Ras GTPase n=1 Tax=Entomophthora muscae TaxID=34485 RepID=A0ACC2RE57_9FUNG|nr:Ras GTPase [Entomophthora muscae]
MKAKSAGTMSGISRAYIPTAIPRDFKIVLFGLGGVGKSAITIQLMRKEFVEEYDPTIEDSYRKELMVDGEEAELNILDTAGQEEYSSMRDQYIRNGHGFMVVYSIDNRESFREANALLKKISQVKDKPYIPLVLVGNKCDLSSRRQVSTKEGQDLARCWNSAFIETSAKLGIHVVDGFEELVRSVRKLRYSLGMATSTFQRSPSGRQATPRSATSTSSMPFPGSPSPLRSGTATHSKESRHKIRDEDEVDLLGCCIIL